MNKYIIHASDKTLLVHNNEKLIRLKCPFKIEARRNYKKIFNTSSFSNINKHNRVHNKQIVQLQHYTNNSLAKKHAV